MKGKESLRFLLKGPCPKGLLPTTDSHLPQEGAFSLSGFYLLSWQVVKEREHP